LKIRTRLLLSLLPPLVGGIALISILFAYHLMGIMTAELTPDLIDVKFRECLVLIFGSAALIILCMVAILYWIANRISRPVQRLNNSALAIAAGQYGESISSQGPKEISELANTLNTMSECLHENLNRLQENSLLRERMYGEYECSMLLQHLMLQKNIDECRSDAIAVKPITAFSSNPKGLLLDFPKLEEQNAIQIHMAEAEEEGFEGMYQLLMRYKYSKEKKRRTVITLDRSRSILEWDGPQIPLLWSLADGQWTRGNAAKVEPGDFFFLFNKGFASFYREPQKIEDFLSKVLKIFAPDGLETTAAMLNKEIGFALRRKDLEADIHLLCFQILNI
jgi:HAMP domain-containing protein